MEQESVASQGDEAAISDEVLSALGIDRATVAQVQEERRQAKEEAIRKAREVGSVLYETVTDPYHNQEREELYLGDDYMVRLSESIADPVHALNAMKQLLASPLEELLPQVSKDRGAIEADEIKPRLRAVLEGFGGAALEHNLLDLGLDAINAATEGGILRNPEALKLLNEKYTTPQAKVYVAERIEAIRNPKPPAGPTVPPPPRPAGPMA